MDVFEGAQGHEEDAGAIKTYDFDIKIVSTGAEDAADFADADIGDFAPEDGAGDGDDTADAGDAVGAGQALLNIKGEGDGREFEGGIHGEAG